MPTKGYEPESLSVASHHTVTAYDDELTRLKNIIAELGGLAEHQLASAVTALDTRDTTLAEKIISGDRRLDTLDATVNSFVLRLLALRQPMARDLRTIVASLRISSDLERIGDLSKNLAKRTLTMARSRRGEAAISVTRAGLLVQTVLRTVIDAYVDENLAKADAAWQQDAAVDDLCASLFSDVLTAMVKTPDSIPSSTHLLFAIKNLERIGDHANNIAESVHFMIAGRRIDDVRPKGADSSFVTPAAKPAPSEG